MTSNIGNQSIAERYAEAILDIALEKNCIDFIKNDLKTFSLLFLENKELKSFLEHPLISLKEKKDVIDKIFTNQISPYVINLIKLLLDRNRLFLFTEINNSFINQFNKKFNIVIAKVTTAIPLDNDIKETLRHKIATILSKHVELQTVVNQEIIGGLIININDKTIDGSIKGKLHSLKRQLI